MSGKPYISVNRATMNAENAPIAFQSRRLAGWKKLSAKKMNTAESMITSAQSP